MIDGCILGAAFANPEYPEKKNGYDWNKTRSGRQADRFHFQPHAGYIVPAGVAALFATRTRHQILVAICVQLNFRQAARKVQHTDHAARERAWRCKGLSLRCFFEGIGAGDYLRTAAGIPIAALLLRLIVLAVALGPRHFSPGKELAKNTIAVVRYSPERPMKSVKVYAPAFLDIALDLHFRFVTMKPMVCE